MNGKRDASSEGSKWAGREIMKLLKGASELLRISIPGETCERREREGE